MSKTIAVVVLSGGLDSCVTAAIAAQTHELALLHVTYGQRTARRERKSFDNIADFFHVPPERRLVAEIGYLARIGGSSLTEAKIDVRMAGKVEQGIPNTYVPFRNTHILSIAVSWGEVINASAVYIGAVEQDSSGYPDCRVEYFNAMQKVVDLGTKPNTNIKIETPVIGMSKAEIVRTGNSLGAPLGLTWSCYLNEDAACGKCDSCALRLQAFKSAGVADTIPYKKIAPA